MKENSTLKISDFGFCHLLSENVKKIKNILGKLS